MKIPKKIVSALTVGVIIASNAAPTVVLANEVKNDANVQISEKVAKNEKSANLTLEKAIENTVGYYKKHNNKLSEFWHLVGLHTVGEDLTSSAYTLPTWDETLITEETSVISDAGYILGLIARGEDPKNFHGRNVAELLASKQDGYYEYNSATGKYEKTEWGFGSFNGANANIWAIIALEIANQEYDKEAAFKTLLECQNATSGGFGLSASWSSTDMTGMALIALPYFQNDAQFAEKANASVEKAVGYIARAKNDDGTFYGSDRQGAADGNSTSMAITGLLSVGEDLDQEKWSNVRTGLLDLQLTEDTVIETWMGEEQHYKGEFYWRKPNQINDTATKQALVALGDLQDDETAWQQLEREYDAFEANRDNVDNDNDNDNDNNDGDVDNDNSGDVDNDNNDNNNGDVDNDNNGDQDNDNNDGDVDNDNNGDQDNDNNDGDVDNDNNGDQDNDNNDEDVDNDNNGDQDNDNNDTDVDNGNNGDVDNNDTDVDNNDQEDHPKTGDTSILGTGLLGLASMIGLGVVNRKRK